jgi:hypothetical protein
MKKMERIVARQVVIIWDPSIRLSKDFQIANEEIDEFMSG